jgi:hypothetical protein
MGRVPFELWFSADASAVDVTSIFADLLARNRGPDPLNPGRRHRPDYGVSASLGKCC